MQTGEIPAGIFSGEMLGNHTDSAGEGILKFKLGFHKSSLSVIQNVIIARNYMNQWIYSHHKVVYSANYLIIDLIDTCCKFLDAEQTPKGPQSLAAADHDQADEARQHIGSRELATSILSVAAMERPQTVGNMLFYLPTDSDLRSLFKQCHVMLKKKQPTSDLEEKTQRLLTEFYTRRYKRSLWKSYAEYHLFWGELSYSLRQQICQGFANLNITSQPNFICFDKTSKNQRIASIAADLEDYGLQNVVWIDPNSSLKELKPDQTFIRIDNNTLRSFRTVSSPNDIRSIDIPRFFYIYYDPMEKEVDMGGFKQYITKTFCDANPTSKQHTYASALDLD